MKKKILAVLLACMMVLAMLPVTALAETKEGNEAKIGETEYATLEEAIEAVQTNEEIYLLKDITREGQDPILIANKFVLDFKGYSITVDKNMFQISNVGWLILRNAEIKQTSDNPTDGFITDCSGFIELQSTAGEGIHTKTSFIKNLKEGSILEIGTATIQSEQYVVEVAEEKSKISIIDGVYTGKSGEEGQPTLTGSIFNNVKGTLTLNGGTYTGGWSCIELFEGAKCDISGNSSFTSYSDAIRAYEGSELIISNCEVNVTGAGYCICAGGGTVSIDAGKYTAEDGGGFHISSGGELTVEALQDVLVEAPGSAVRIDGKESTAEIKGGTYLSSGVSDMSIGCVEQYNGELTITGGSFTGRDAGLLVDTDSTDSSAIADIKGGTFTATDAQGAGLHVAGGKVNIESGTFEGKGSNGQAFFLESGTATVSGGTFNAEDGYGIWNNKNNELDPGHLTINDCTVNSKDVALYFTGTEDNEINGGTYTSETTNALIVNSSKAVVSSGLFTNAAGDAAIKDADNGLVIAEGSAAVPADWRDTSASVVRISFPVASIDDTEYASLEEAVKASKDGDIIVLLKDIVNYDRPAIEINNQVTLDFNGHKIIVNENMFQINERASLTLEKADIQQLKTSERYDVDYAFIKDCKGDLVINSTVGGDRLGIDLGEALINTLYSTGSFTMNGGTVKSPERIIRDVEKGAVVTMNDGELIADNGQSGDYTHGDVFSNFYGDFTMNGGKLHSGITAFSMGNEATATLNGGEIESVNEGIIAKEKSTIVVNNIEIDAPVGCIQVSEGCSLDIQDGIFYSSARNTISVARSSTANLYGGQYVGSVSTVFASGKSNVTIYDGIYKLQDPNREEECGCIVFMDSEGTIEGGTFYAEDDPAVQLVGGELTVDGGTITSEEIGIEILQGNVTVNGGIIDASKGNSCIFLPRFEDWERDLSDTVTINGGKFLGADGQYCVWSKYGHIIVNDGTFQSGYACVYGENGENQINGGEFTSKEKPAVNMIKDATLVLTGGKFTNESGEIALPDQENVVIAQGYKADPENWKETEASVIEVVKGVYKVIEGANSEWKAGSEKGLQFRADGEFAKFLGVRVDGKELKKSDYKAWSGSTYVELQPSFLNNLSVGKHDLELQFTDGTAKTGFTIQGKNPVTADSSNGILWMVFAMIFGAALVVSARKFAEKRK